MRELIPIASCTEKGCPVDNPCCNVCTFQGWREKESGLPAQSTRQEELPNCSLDGCGRCPMMSITNAEGYVEGKTFKVTNWTELDSY